MNTERVYICITVSHKNTFENGFAKYMIVEMSEDQIAAAKAAVYEDRRPSENHCIKIFSDCEGMIYGRNNKKVQEIINAGNCMISSRTGRSNNRIRAKLHYQYCQARTGSIDKIQEINKEYDL